MTRYYIEALAWVTAAAFTTVAALRWHSAVEDLPAQAAAAGPAPVMIAPPNPVALDRDAESIIARNPFRLSRARSAVFYQLSAERNARAGAPQAPRPALVLKGIIGGPPWMALLDGIPGELPGLLIREGSTYGALVVRTITRDTVVVKGADTTWHLTLAKGRP